MRFYCLVTSILIQLAIGTNAQNLGAKKNDDISFANSNSYIIKENGVNRICIYQSKSPLDWRSEIWTCIQYNKDDIAIQRDYHYPTLLGAESVFIMSEQEYTKEIFPYWYYDPNNGGGKRYNPKTREYIMITVDKDKNWYCVSYSYQ